jgi:hypothetical protein
VISERTARLFEEHPPEAQTGSPTPTLAELFHEVEVAAKFGTRETSSLVSSDCTMTFSTPSSRMWVSGSIDT